MFDVALVVDDLLMLCEWSSPRPLRTGVRLLYLPKRMMIERPHDNDDGEYNEEADACSRQRLSRCNNEEVGLCCIVLVGVLHLPSDRIGISDI